MRLRALVLGLAGALGMGGSFAYSGCAGCEDYVQCTTRAGLRYSLCGDGSYEFNDGTIAEDDAAAFEYCFCSLINHTCGDGRRMTACGGLGDPDVASFDDGTVLTFADGYAECFGFESCSLASMFCSQGRWFLSCDAGGQTTYVAHDGTTFSADSQAATYCNLPIGD